MSLLSNKIVACTSEDGSHPVRELLDFHAQSRGWQSARWSEYPQALVLQFPDRVMLQQVQVLSHQFKIASRVEIFIGDMPPGVPSPHRGSVGVEYVRLGHFSLDSNERSGFQARELKTVYVPQGTQGTHLRLVLHKCHVNEHNLYNQVGVLAVRAVGRVVAVEALLGEVDRDEVRATILQEPIPDDDGAALLRLLAHLARVRARVAGELQLRPPERLPEHCIHFLQA